MERRTALAYAAAAAGVALAGSTAFAATSGMLGDGATDPVEIEGISTAADDDVQASATTPPESTVVTVVVDEYVSAPAPGSSPAVDDRAGLRLASASDDARDVSDGARAVFEEDDEDDDHDGDWDADDDRDDHDDVEVEDD